MQFFHRCKANRALAFTECFQVTNTKGLLERKYYPSTLSTALLNKRHVLKMVLHSHFNVKKKETLQQVLLSKTVIQAAIYT